MLEMVPLLQYNDTIYAVCNTATAHIHTPPPQCMPEYCVAQKQVEREREFCCAALLR